MIIYDVVFIVVVAHHHHWYDYNAIVVINRDNLTYLHNKKKKMWTGCYNLYT